jgi:1-aminocyclopropane-1-carboxylate deaminase/D-cysteine desulfhydrase-like pyridoxal-dependent ACC family enzyme
MPRLSRELGGPELLIKRDDLTGLAFGGNKARKLEPLVAAAEREGARTLLTRGAAQSNHCRQTAAAAARRGMNCVLVLTGGAPVEPNGNLLLDALLGAELLWTEGRDPEQVLDEAFEAALAAGRRPYRIPYGGSSPLGAAAYAEALGELLRQEPSAAALVLASSSGGTQAGLIAGARMHGFTGRILGVSVEPRASELRERIAGLATEVLRVHGEAGQIKPEQVEATDEFLGGGYGVVGELERFAIRTFARTEGLLLDPVYTGRAAGALLEMARRNELKRGQRVVFWHTGGTPALFAYAARL